MTKTIKIIMLILTETLVFVPFGVLLAFNIIDPAAPESHTLFRVMTVAYYAANILLIPALSLWVFKDDDRQATGCLWVISVFIMILLLLTAEGKRFFGSFSLPAHTAAGISKILFFLLFAFSWFYPPFIGIRMLIDRKSRKKHAEDIAEAAAEGSSSDAFLQGLAENDESETVRKTSFERLTKQENFEHILLFGKYTDTRVMAVQKITDEQILIRTAENDEDESVRKAAAAMLKDDAALAWIIRNDSSAIVRESAAAGINDEKILRETAEKDESAAVRRTAMRRISDRDVLLWIAEKDPDESIRREAFERTGDPETLKQILTRDPGWVVWPAAVRMLTDQPILEQIAQNTRNKYDTRVEAVRLIDSQELLAKLTIADPDFNVRLAARKKVQSDALIRAVEETDSPEIYTPETAIRLIKKTETLKKIAKRDHVPDAREAAVSRINDPDFLAEVAVGDKEASVRKAAVEKISDPAVLRMVIKEDNSKDVVQIAVRRTSDANMKIFGWEKILKQDPKNIAAADVLRNLYLENRIAKHVWEDHHHTDYEDNSGVYCCYSDYNDYSDTDYHVEPD